MDKPSGLPKPKGLPVKLVSSRTHHQQNVIDLLTELLADAEAGEIVAFSGVAEYRTEYRDVQSGCRNPYSMAGAHFRAAIKHTES